MSKWRVPWWLAALPVLLLVINERALYTGLQDDAYISLVYARNLAEGSGLVFHPDLPRTEGYSNLLWTWLLSLAISVGENGPAAARSLGIALMSATLLVVQWRVRGVNGLFAALAIAASPITAAWAGAGLEGSLLTFLLVLGCTGLGSSWAAPVWGLVGITRVEGIVYSLTFVLHALWNRRRIQAWEWAALLGPTLLQLVWRYAYYGHLLPAPVLAKSEGGFDAEHINQGIRYIGAALVADPGATLLWTGALVAACIYAWREGDIDDRILAPAGAATLLFAFAVGSGGDWMGNARFLQPAVALLWLAAARALPNVLPTWGLMFASAGLAAAIGSFNHMTPPLFKDRIALQLAAGSTNRPRSLTKAQSFILHELPAGEAVLVPDVGQLAWLCECAVLDPQGLAWYDTAEALANHGNGEDMRSKVLMMQTVEQLRPAVIALPVSETTGAPMGPVGEALTGTDGSSPPKWFTEDWSPWRVEPYGAGAFLQYFLRDDLPEALEPGQRAERYLDLAVENPNYPVFLWRAADDYKTLGKRSTASKIENEALVRGWSYPTPSEWHVWTR